MFSGKDLKIKLIYMGFGGVIAIIGMLFAIGMLSSVTAQRDKFGEIECTSLRVVDADGNTKVVLTITETGGRVIVGGKDGESTAAIGINEYGGSVVASGKDGKSVASLRIENHGGSVFTVDIHGEGKFLD